MHLQGWSWHLKNFWEWRRIFIADWIKSLGNVQRFGKPRTYDHEKVRNDIMKMLGKPLPKGSSQRVAKTVAEKLVVSEDIVGRILRANHIKFCRAPHTWCVSMDPMVAKKSTDEEILYMNPIKNTAVVTVNEKPSIQAAERRNGYVRTGTVIRGKKSTFERYGTMTSLFAAVAIKKGKAWNKTYERKRRIEFMNFMDYVMKSVPGASDPDNGIKLHVVFDNYRTLKVCEERHIDHKNVFLHFTPTNASWLNLGEVFFGKIRRKLLKNGNFKSKREIPQTIKDFVKVHNKSGISYRWR
jgi:hypothetical protein